MSNPVRSANDGAAPGIRAAQKVETRARILDCAIKAFAESGFDASTRDIAAAADVRHSTIRYHFQDKEGLWAASTERLFERLHRQVAMSEAETALPLREQFRIWIKRYVQYCADVPEHARIMAHESMRDSARFERMTKSHTKSDHKKVQGFLNAMRQEGLVPEISIISLSYSIVGLAQTPFVLGSEVRHLHGVDVFNETFVEQHAEAVFKLVVR